MFNSAKTTEDRRLQTVDRSQAGTEGTVIARGVKLEGDFSSQGDVVIEGEVVGTLSAAGLLRVGAEAVIKADIKAGEAIIAGSVEGDLTVERRLDLMTTARIKGDITTETISVEAGAVLEGKVSASGPSIKPLVEKEGEGA
jgi:cytoskeletal protein CcmA (bactofilin family)